MKLADKLKKKYEDLLISKGEYYLYKFAIGSGFSEKSDKSEITLLDRAEAFFAIFRQTGNENYFIIGKILRRAAHRLYRHRLKNSVDCAINTRFLNAVK